jgi:hypothetical protein
MNRIKLPSQQELNDRFIYKDGQLYVKSLYEHLSKNHKDLLDSDLSPISRGWDTPRGYQMISIDNQRYALHRIIYKMFKGEEPENIDHKDGNPRNNKIENLRHASESQNHQNRPAFKNNKLGIKNIRVHSFKRDGTPRYQVEIDLNKTTTAKLFSDLKDAIEYRNSKLKELHGEFARHE